MTERIRGPFYETPCSVIFCMANSRWRKEITAVDTNKTVQYFETHYKISVDPLVS